MDRQQQTEYSKKFRDMHKGRLFLLPNAWDGGSAKIFSRNGFEAVGTTSAGIAYSKGLADGENISFDDLSSAAASIISAADCPVSIDIERGFGQSFDDICANVEALVNLGAVGINIEDGIPSEGRVDTIDYFSELISEISSLRDSSGIPFVINARTDIFLLNTDRPENMMRQVCCRAERLQKAGADCIFIPGALDEQTICSLRASISMPVNLFVHKKFNDVKRLAEIGINRLSSGSAPVRTAYSALIDTSAAFYRGDCAPMLAHGFDYAAANDFFGVPTDV